MRFLDGIQILALQIFHQRHLEHLGIGGLAHHGGHGVEPCNLRGAPTAFARDQFVLVANLPHDQWLNDAIGFDGLRQALQRRAVKFLARLQRARLHLFPMQPQHALAFRNGGHSRGGRAGGSFLFGSQQRA